MSYQVVITFDIDETKVQENAEKEAGRQIAKQIIESAFGHYNRDAVMARYVQNTVKEILTPEKDRIISEAIKEVVGSLSKSKVVRERLREEIDGEKGS